MRRLTGVLSVVTGFVLITGVAAQERPDFSGAWDIAPAPTAGRRAPIASDEVPRNTMGSGWGPSITIAQDMGTLTVERVFFVRGDMQPALKFRYSLDGSETRNAVMMGRGMQEQVSRASWKGDKLIITTAHTYPNPEDGRTVTYEVIQTLSLQSSSSLVGSPSLVVETTISDVPGGVSSSTRTYYANR